MATASNSLARRSILAVALLVGFYVLAVGISAALVVLPVVIPHVPAKLAIVCWIGGGVILWSILPRIDRFAAPGPRITRESDPRFFAEIESIAAATGQAMPEDVYVVNEVNAFVTERGRWMGLGSRRVMGIGLPLMHGLTVSEMRAVIAHEFGHFHGGDTKLGPWIYKTRGAIGRTIGNLVKRESLVLHKPFLWYGNMFLRLTQSISREQEFAADRLAAEVVGAGALSDGLRKLPRLAPGFDRYFHTEYAPVLNAGMRPPLLRGFQEFLDEPSVSTVLAQMGTEAEGQESGDVYDSHPPLKARIDAVRGVRSGSDARDARRATELLEDPDAVELALLAYLASGTDVSQWPVVGWEEVGDKVVIPSWEAFCRDNSRALAGVRVDDLAGLARDLEPVHRKMGFEKGGQPREVEVATTRALLDRALALALRREGWRIRMSPGSAVLATKGSESLSVLGLMDRIAADPGVAAEWASTCARLGIGEFGLQPVESSAAA